VRVRPKRASGQCMWLSTFRHGAIEVLLNSPANVRLFRLAEQASLCHSLTKVRGHHLGGPRARRRAAHGWRGRGDTAKRMRRAGRAAARWDARGRAHSTATWRWGSGRRGGAMTEGSTRGDPSRATGRPAPSRRSRARFVQRRAGRSWAVRSRVGARPISTQSDRARSGH
jgi:hypothetical protein